MSTPPEAESPQGVGYRRAPLDHRFKPGTSSNPNGRPRKRRIGATADNLTIADMLLKEAREPIAVLENGVRTKLPAVAAAVRRSKIAAVSGDGISNRRFVAHAQRAEKEKAKEIRNWIKNVGDYKRRCEVRRRQSEMEGEEEPVFLPDPHDIVVDHEIGEITLNGLRDVDDKMLWDEASNERQILHDTIT